MKGEAGMSNADTLVRKQDLNYAAQKQKEMFALKTDVPDDYIISGEQTTTSSADGGTNVYTFKKKGGGTSTFTVKNGSKGATGAQGPKGDTGATGAQGPKGDTGATGAQGPKGNTGAAGANGTSAVWFSGTAVTGTSTTAVTVTVSGSKAGDMYLNTSTYNVYKASAANSWIYVCNIKGATGATGAKGATGAQGPKGDAGAAGAAGVRGSQMHWGTGITGTSTTATVFSSSGVSSALVNDLYLNTSTWNIYQCTVSGAASTAKWVYKGNIKGASGATASTGTPTTAGLTRLYTGTGTNTNGTMTQKAITDELGKCLKTENIDWITEADIDAMYASV